MSDTFCRHGVSTTFERATPSVVLTVFTGYRPEAASATARSVFLPAQDIPRPFRLALVSGRNGVHFRPRGAAVGGRAPARQPEATREAARRQAAPLKAARPEVGMSTIKMPPPLVPNLDGSRRTMEEVRCRIAGATAIPPRCCRRVRGGEWRSTPVQGGPGRREDGRWACRRTTGAS